MSKPSHSAIAYFIVEGGLVALEDPTGQGDHTLVQTQAFRDHAGHVWAFRAWIPAGVAADQHADRIADGLAQVVFRLDPQFHPRTDAVIDAVVTPEGRDEATSGAWYQIRYEGEAPRWSCVVERVAPKVHLVGMLRGLSRKEAGGRRVVHEP
ncbi:uncharacterized protein BO72DRAFT_492573 [Aspergillus fijiensis CBS 313.89]|uniref:Uncharacterized protein n=1 Tax=Aspergillus fijiensis CBS 313.89 TaxID=1448319 RepID=A0A8G1W5F0_9EURO|nr:uncharacterized protein BO72DRAFT_492573 [Aspergillus fijiensis CBS 313.89]RAK81154.1 hypothetical protein BO72DRAFT_492573 [Aspergillus fijiensis CBS 313.89]